MTTLVPRKMCFAFSPAAAGSTVNQGGGGLCNTTVLRAIQTPRIYVRTWIGTMLPGHRPVYTTAPNLETSYGWIWR
jgi:hypothetical protein